MVTIKFSDKNYKDVNYEVDDFTTVLTFKQMLVRDKIIEETDDLCGKPVWFMFASSRRLPLGGWIRHYDSLFAISSEATEWEIKSQERRGLGSMGRAAAAA